MAYLGKGVRELLAYRGACGEDLDHPIGGRKERGRFVERAVVVLQTAAVGLEVLGDTGERPPWIVARKDSRAFNGAVSSRRWSDTPLVNDFAICRVPPYCRFALSGAPAVHVPLRRPASFQAFRLIRELREVLPVVRRGNPPDFPHIHAPNGYAML